MSMNLKMYFLQMEDQIGQANARSWSKSLEECRKESQLFHLKLRVLTIRQALSKLFSSTSMSPLLRKNDAKKTGDCKREREHTFGKKKMYGSDNFLDLNGVIFVFPRE